MSDETYVKAEIIYPHPSFEKLIELFFKALLGVAIITVFVWWFFASWYPEFGFTYWQLILPVTVIKLLFSSGGVHARMLDK